MSMKITPDNEVCFLIYIYIILISEESMEFDVNIKFGYCHFYATHWFAIYDKPVVHFCRNRY